MNLRGRSEYATSVESGIGPLTLVVRCNLSESLAGQRAFVDTGARWSILPGDFAEAAGIDPNSTGFDQVVLQTRLGTFHSFLERAPITL